LKSKFSRSWTNRFGTAFVTLEGGTGQQHLLLLAPFELSSTVLEELRGLQPFKGRLTLAVLEQMHVTPVRAAILEIEPRAVVALQPSDGIITSGESQTIEPGTHLSPTGLEYHEPEALEAWSSGFQSAFPAGQTGHSVAASVASSLGVSAVACGPSQLKSVLAQLLEFAF
jgi:hypothetical protein